MSSGDRGPRLRVLLADDTPDIRLLLSAALNALGGFDVVGEAENGVEAIRLASALRPDAVLLDLAMPVMDGLQAAPEIRKCSPQTRIVILSGFSKDRMEAEALEVGADAYIEKGACPRDIADAIRGLCDGGPRGGERVTPTHVVETPLREQQVVALPRDTLEEWRRSISRAVERVPELAKAFGAFGEVVGERVRFDRAGLCIADEAGYKLAAVCGADDGRLPIGATVPFRGRAATELDDGRSVVSIDTANSDETADKYFNDRGMRSFAAVPILAAGRAQAIVGFSAFEPDSFSAEELELLEEAVRAAAAPFYMLYYMKRKQDHDTASADSDQARAEWDRIVRHDLKSPLAVISGFARTMQDGWTDISDEKKLEFVGAILRGATSIGTLLSDMEHVDNLESGVRIDPAKPVDLVRLVEQTVTDVVGSGGRTVVTNIEEGLPVALADEASQRRVLGNLLENAFKFSAPEEPVEVTVAHEKDTLHVTVRDYGTGISPEGLEKLFKKFSRLAAPDGTHRVRGSGLGLYICKRLVEAQGGTIAAESAVGSGSKFSYTVPVSPSTSA